MVDNDKKIIELFVDRSEQAIAEAGRVYGAYLMKVAFSILQNEQDAEECVNDTYLRAWNSIPPASPEKLRPYLGKIVRNRAFDCYEHARAEKRSAEIIQLCGELADVLPDNTVGTGGEEISAAVDAFLRTLPKLHRVLFVRRYWYADSIERLASITGMSKSKITSILFRVRKSLRGYLEREGISI